MLPGLLIFTQAVEEDARSKSTRQLWRQLFEASLVT